MYFCIPVFSSLIANSKHPQDSTEFQQVIGPDMQQVFDTPTKWGPFEKCMDIDEKERKVGRKIKTARENINGGRKKRNQLWRYSGYSEKLFCNEFVDWIENVYCWTNSIWWNYITFSAEIWWEENRNYQHVFGLTAKRVGEFQFDIIPLDDENVSNCRSMIKSYSPKDFYCAFLAVFKNFDLMRLDTLQKFPTVVDRSFVSHGDLVWSIFLFMFTCIFLETFLPS